MRSIKFPMPRGAAHAGAMQLALSAAVIGVTMLAGHALAGNDPAAECDRLAGVEWEKINQVPAISACGKAVRQEPDSVRLQYQYAQSLLKGGYPALAADAYGKAAHLGYAPAQYTLGYLYMLGNGVPRDTAEAARLYRKAADQRYPMAQYMLGNLYFNGNGVPKDYAEAEKLYRDAAGPEEGLHAAQYRLGWMYLNGYGVAKDLATAVAWFHKAALQGHGEAQTLLAAAFEEGSGTIRDLEQARHWYQEAAKQGVKRAAERAAALSAQAARDALNGPAKKMERLVIAPQGQAVASKKDSKQELTAGEALVGLALFGLIYGIQNGSFKSDGLAGTGGSDCYPGAFSCNVDTNNYLLWESVR